MIGKMENKTLRFSVAFGLLFLVLLSISVFTFPHQEQRKAPTSVEFSVPFVSDPSAFVSIWNTSLISSGSSNSNQVRLPLQSEGVYNFTVDWGDISTDIITTWNQTNVTHTYASAGVYTITITGMIEGWWFDYWGTGSDRLKILEIQQWGCLQLGNSGSYFYKCSNLELTATDNLNLTGTTNLSEAFGECTNLGSNGNMNGWDVSNVTDMSFMFYKAATFSQPIGDWDTSSVMTMYAMFAQATSFNQPLDNWNVSRVADMGYMFTEATMFNQSIGVWDVSCVTTMLGMFRGAFTFNQPLGDWDVSSVTSMWAMFDGANSFNQPIGGWNVSNVTDMSWMFRGVTLSTSNYDNLLIGWSKLPLKHGVNFDGGTSKYSIHALNARQSIITNYNWIITDGGLIPGIAGYNLIVVIAIFGVSIVLGLKRKLLYRDD